MIQRHASQTQCSGLLQSKSSQVLYLCAYLAHMWAEAEQPGQYQCNIKCHILKKKYASRFCSSRKLPYCPYILLMTTPHLTIYTAKKLHHSHELYISPEVVVAAFMGCDPL